MGELEEVEGPERRNAISASQRELEETFEQLNRDPRRLKAISYHPISTLAAPFELAVIQCLRALELTDAATAALDQRNHVAAFPIIRSLFEIGVLLLYAAIRCKALVIDSERWGRRISSMSRMEVSYLASLC